jgi:hypothetical protein
MSIGRTLFGGNGSNFAFEDNDVFAAGIGKRNLKLDANLCE